MKKLIVFEDTEFTDKIKLLVNEIKWLSEQCNQSHSDAVNIAIEKVFKIKLENV